MEKFAGKEKDILQATIQMLRQGILPSELKVADIAEKAGIGKGTIYEYFSTKEDIIKSALEYMIVYIIQKIREVLHQEGNLKTIFCDMLQLIETYFENGWFVVNLFTVSVPFENWGAFFSNCKYTTGENASIIEEEILSIYERAKQEYNVNKNLPIQYLRMALLGTVKGYIGEYHMQKDITKSNIEQFRESAFDMFIATLQV